MNYIFRVLLMAFAIIISPVVYAVGEEAQSPALQASQSVYRTWLTKEVPSTMMEGLKLTMDSLLLSKLENNKYISTPDGKVLFKFDNNYYMVISHGTSYAVGKNGVMASNWHVIVDEDIPETTPFIVEKIDPLFKVHKGKVLWSDDKKDLSVTKYDSFNPKVLEIDESVTKQGADIFAIGFPGLSDELSGHLEDPIGYVTPGITDGLLKKEAVRENVKYWEHNADINHGNSGGPLVNACGYVVGTNQSGITSTSGYYLAVRSGELASVLKELDVEYVITDKVCDPSAMGTPSLDSITKSPKMLYIGLGLLGVSILGLVAFLMAKSKKPVPQPKAQMPMPAPADSNSNIYKDEYGRRYMIDDSGNHIPLDNPTPPPVPTPAATTPTPTAPAKSLHLSAVNGAPSINLVANKPVKIGRSGGCDVVVSNGKVSGQHAEIVYDGTNVFITDLNSTNGTYVNGSKVSGRQVVNPDSKISLTQDDLAVWNYGQPRANVNKTVGMMNVGMLRSLNGQARDINLTTNSTIRIGRNTSNDVVINVSEVSSRHCKIEVSNNGTIRLIDSNSTNGTFYQSMNNRITDTVLHTGDVFYLAGQNNGFRLDRS